MTDESIVNLSDTTKAAMRNYAMVAGFMILFIYAAIAASIFFSGKYPSEALGMSNFIFLRFLIGASLMAVGGILAFLHKRDLVAITFILMAVDMMITPIFYLIYSSGHAYLSLPAMIVFFILGVAMLFTRNEQKYVCGLILLPFSLITMIYGLNHVINIYAVSNTILAVVSLYGALCIGLENPKFPGYRLLTADEIDETKDGSPVHFKISGSILGFALIMIPSVCVVLNYFSIGGITVENVSACDVACGLMLVFVGFLMLTAGRMKFTPFMFILLGIVIAIRPILTMQWLVIVFFLVIGLICLLRPDRRVLAGISVILLGLTGFFCLDGVFHCEEANVALAIMIAVIQAYICFALCSDNRLKLI